jgi:hypothetical protein
MARRDLNTSTTLAISVVFEARRLSPACVAQAYAQVVPLPPRTAARASHRERARGEQTVPPVGRRAAS